MKEEKQFLVDLQHESNKIPETNKNFDGEYIARIYGCLLYTSPSPRDLSTSRMPSSA